MCGRLPHTLALFAVLDQVCPRTIKSFLPYPDVTHMSKHTRPSPACLYFKRWKARRCLGTRLSYKSKTTLAENHRFLYSTGTKKGVLHCVFVQRPSPIVWVCLLTDQAHPWPCHCIAYMSINLLKNVWYWPKPVLGYELSKINIMPEWSSGLFNDY